MVPIKSARSSWMPPPVSGSLRLAIRVNSASKTRSVRKPSRMWVLPHFAWKPTLAALQACRPQGAPAGEYPVSGLVGSRQRHPRLPSRSAFAACRHEKCGSTHILDGLMMARWTTGEPFLHSTVTYLLLSLIRLGSVGDSKWSKRTASRSRGLLHDWVIAPGQWRKHLHGLCELLRDQLTRYELKQWRSQHWRLRRSPISSVIPCGGTASQHGEHEGATEFHEDLPGTEAWSLHFGRPVIPCASREAQNCLSP